MDCPYCHKKNITTNKCPDCKAFIPMVKEPKEEVKEKGKIFKKERK